jgi:drug/metabolite transporter (DMT)-like permease
MRSRAAPFLVLAGAVAVVSTSSLMIRGAQAEGVPSLAIAFWRLAIASVILMLVLGAKTHLRRSVVLLTSRQKLLLIASGAFLAAHIASWIASLAYTSVASSTALVTTNPVWLALFAWYFLSERPDRWLLAGVAVSVIGSSLIVYSDASLAVGDHPDSALGNGLALLGSFTVCGYLLVGRKLASTMPTLVYVTGVFSIAALCLLAACLAASVQLMGFTTFAWLCLAGLAIGPQLIGHSSINWALQHLSPTMVAVAILGEPVGAALLAWWVLGEPVSAWQLAGFCAIGSGILLTARSSSGSSRQVTNASTTSARI